MKWRTNFINSGQSLHSTTLETLKTLKTLKTYMVYQEQQTDAQRRKKGKETKKQGEGRNDFRQSNINRTFNQVGWSFQASNASNNNKKKRKRLTNDNDCPIHETAHKWGQCHQNQYGDNFRPHRQSPNESNSSHLTSSTFRSFARSNYSTRNRPPSQVYFNHGNQYQRPAMDTNSYLSMSSSTNYTDSESGRDRNEHRQRDAHYIHHSTNDDNNTSIDHLPEGRLSLRKLNGLPVYTYIPFRVILPSTISS